MELEINKIKLPDAIDNSEIEAIKAKYVKLAEENPPLESAYKLQMEMEIMKAITRQRQEAIAAGGELAERIIAENEAYAKENLSIIEENDRKLAAAGMKTSAELLREYEEKQRNGAGGATDAGATQTDTAGVSIPSDMDSVNIRACGRPVENVPIAFGIDMGNMTVPFSDGKQISWYCGCGKLNSGKFCTECGSPKKLDRWVCICGQENHSRFCTECGRCGEN